MAKAIQTIAAIIFDKKKDYSFLVLKKQGTWTGWQFVQGEKEKDEEWETAVRREVKEETGLADIEIVKKLDIKSDYWFVWEGEKIHKFLTFFLVKADKKQKIKLSVEHSGYKWCGYQEALKSLKYNKEQFKQAFKALKGAEI
jgi:8-oxo-dGTP pyrophosphatase MutT (NUDIX family)